MKSKTKGKPRIVHLTSVHEAQDVRIFHKECRSLARAGYAVTLIAPQDRMIEKDGIRVLAVPRCKGRLKRMSITVWRTYRLARKERGQLYHLHDPELLFVGMILRLGGAKVLYDVHEDVQRQILYKFWINARFRKAVARAFDLVDLIASFFISGFVAATPAIARKYPARKTILVQNYPILGELVRLGDRTKDQQKNIVCYVGGITKVRGAFEMIKAIELLPESLGIELHMAGKMSPVSIEKDLRGLLGWGRVFYLGWLAREKMSDYLAAARVGLLVFHPVPNHIEAQPNKLFEYMSAGIPVVASDFPLWRGIIEQSKCGILVNPMEPAAIAEAIKWLIEHPDEAEEMGRRGAEIVRQKYNWDAEAERLINFYERIL